MFSSFQSTMGLVCRNKRKIGRQYDPRPSGLSDIQDIIHTDGLHDHPAPFAVYLDEINNTYVEPDISVICDPNKLDDKGCKGAPDWIIEIVSPASRKMDYLLKLFKYRSAGVREYWIVDIAKNRITVYNFNHDYSTPPERRLPERNR